MKSLGATILGDEGLIIQEGPDNVTEKSCKDLGKILETLKTQERQDFL